MFSDCMFFSHLCSYSVLCFTFVLGINVEAYAVQAMTELAFVAVAE